MQSGLADQLTKVRHIMSNHATGPPDDFWGFVIAASIIFALLYDNIRPSFQVAYNQYQKDVAGYMAYTPHTPKFPSWGVHYRL